MYTPCFTPRVLSRRHRLAGRKTTTTTLQFSRVAHTHIPFALKIEVFTVKWWTSAAPAAAAAARRRCRYFETNKILFTFLRAAATREAVNWKQALSTVNITRALNNSPSRRPVYYTPHSVFGHFRVGRAAHPCNGQSNPGFIPFSPAAALASSR